MQTCEHCTQPIPPERGIDSRIGGRRIVKYCSDRCRRTASAQRRNPPCSECGKPLNHHSTGICGDCGRIWTRSRIIDAIQDYADRYGHPPSARDWNPALARAGRRDDVAERFYEDDCWPATSLVQHYFGTWNTAIKAAEFTPLKPGHKYADQQH